MSRLVTVLVMCMVLVAGCSGAPTSGNGDSSPDGESENVVTYMNETGDGALILEVDHSTETYDMVLNGTVESTSNLTRQYTIGMYCKALSDTAYNYTEGEMSIAENETSYTKITASGDMGQVSDLPDDVFLNYEPITLQATIHAENGTKLNVCSVNGEDNFSYEQH